MRADATRTPFGKHDQPRLARCVCGSVHRGTGLLGTDTFQGFLLEDYPAAPHEQLTTATAFIPATDRPPLTEIVMTLLQTGATSALSLEVFNRQHWAQDAFEVAKTGLAKMEAAAAKATSSLQRRESGM